MTTPAYEYSALLDLSSFKIQGKEVITLIEQTRS